MKSNHVPGTLPLDGQLAPCPKKANCVSTTHSNINRQIPPVSFAPLKVDQAMQLLGEVVSGMPKTEIVKQESNYLYAVAKTMIFEFLHDVELLLDESTQELHIRSASRIGLTDFGTNKRRMQAVSARFLKRKNEHLETQQTDNQ